MTDMVFAVAAASMVAAGWLPLAVRRQALAASSILAAATGATTWMDQGLRWQQVPILVCISGAAVLGLVRLRRSPDRSARARLALRVAAVGATAGCLAAAMLGGVAAWAFRAVELPIPTGPLPVGTTVMEWVDSSRREVATPRLGAHRTVVAQIWYPATAAGPTNEGARYLAPRAEAARVTAAGISTMLGIPAFLLDDAARARTSATEGATAASHVGGFPVVLFSPGLASVRTQNTAWAQELASHGYVVLALDHVYDSAVVVMDDGTVVRSQLGTTGNTAEDDRAAARWTSIRAADLRFALTQLEAMGRRPGGPFNGRLDTRRSVAVGHSLGGAAAIQAAAQDPRFDAVINIDGFPHYLPPGGFPQPLLALVAGVGTGSEAGDAEYARRLRDVLGRSTADSYSLLVPGAGHLSFTDAAVFLPPVPSLFGSVKRTEVHQIMTGATLAFLDATVGSGTGDVATQLSQFGILTPVPART